MNSTDVLIHESFHLRSTDRHLKRVQTNLPIQKLSIIVPCYNEAATITAVLDKIMEVTLLNGIEKQIIVVNDCSTDETASALQNYMLSIPQAPIQYIQHSLNQGKGAAIHSGLALATGDYVIIQDADFEYDPNEYNILLQPVLTAQADVVYGSRFMGGNPHRVLFFWHTIGNRCLTFISNLLSNLNLTDMETGYKLFRTSVIQTLRLREKRFGFEPEVTLKLSRVPNIKVFEVGISYYGRTYKEGKKIRLKDAFRCIYCLLKYYFLSEPSENELASTSITSSLIPSAKQEV